MTWNPSAHNRQVSTQQSTAFFILSGELTIPLLSWWWQLERVDCSILGSRLEPVYPADILEYPNITTHIRRAAGTNIHSLNCARVVPGLEMNSFPVSLASKSWQ